MFIDIRVHFQRNPGFLFNGKPYFSTPGHLRCKSGIGLRKSSEVYYAQF